MFPDKWTRELEVDKEKWVQGRVFSLVPGLRSKYSNLVDL